jgi:hypothetical protein
MKSIACRFWLWGSFCAWMAAVLVGMAAPAPAWAVNTVTGTWSGIETGYGGVAPSYTVEWVLQESAGVVTGTEFLFASAGAVGERQWSGTRAGSVLTLYSDDDFRLDATVSGSTITGGIWDLTAPGLGHPLREVFLVLSPRDRIENLQGVVEDFVAANVLGAGQGRSLTVKLLSARRSLDKGHTNAAINQLGAFSNQANALVRSRALPAAQGAVLIGEASGIIAQLGG